MATAAVALAPPCSIACRRRRPSPPSLRVRTSLHSPSLSLSCSSSSSSPSPSPRISPKYPFPGLFPASRRQAAVVAMAAWTRRPAAAAAKKRRNKKSWKQRTEMYMRPFMLRVFFSRRYIHAKVVHRSTCKVVSSASTNAGDLRYSLPSLTVDEACRTIGRLIAERCTDADVFVIAFDTKLKDEKIDGRLAVVVDAIKDQGIIVDQV